MFKTPEEIRARLAEIQASLQTYSASADLSDADVEAMKTLNSEFKALSTKLTALEDAAANVAALNASARQTAPAQPAARTPRIEVGASATDKFGGFKSTGDFLMGVRNAANGKFAPQFNSAMYEKNAEDGGFLVPEELSLSIVKKLESKDSLMSMTTQLKTGSNNMSLTVDESQPWNQGIQAYWVAEGNTYTETKPKFTQADFRLHKLGVLVKPTDELLEDSVGLESYINQMAPTAMMYKLNNAIIQGDGVGKPSGFLNSSFALTVDKEGSQTLDIVPLNVIKMYSRLFPNSRANSVWVMNAGLEESLWSMKDDDGRYIYLAPGSEMNQSPYGRLMGRPVLPMLSGMPAAGDAGAIALVDLSYYYTLTKAGNNGIKSAVSIHAEFARDITSFKFTMRVDGKVPFKTPVTTEFGAYQVSAITKMGAI